MTESNNKGNRLASINDRAKKSPSFRFVAALFIEIWYAFKKLWVYYGLVVTIVGGSALSFFKPKIDFKPGPSANPRYALESYFSITNNSDFFDIKNIKPILITDIVFLENRSSIRGVKVEAQGLIFDDLASGEEVNFPLSRFQWAGDENGRARIVFGLIAFQVNYDFLGFACKDLYYYKTVLDNAGNAIWFKMPTGDFTGRHRYHKEVVEMENQIYGPDSTKK